MGKMTGNEFLVKALQEEGVEKIFGYPGACVIDIFDEIYKQDQVELILPRHEQGLIHAADGYARATGKVGVCLATSGPGATNLVTGIATANYDSVPLVCFTGQVATNLIGNDTFQEIDIVGVTRNIAKFVIVVRKREDLNRLIKEAFYIARTGKPGPVLLDLPKDVMAELGSDEYPEEVNIRGYKPNTKPHHGQILRAMNMIYDAKRPLFLIGGGAKIAGAQEEMCKLMETLKVPVVTTIMGRGIVPTNHELYYGNIGMHGNYAANQAVNGCDLLISIGTRFNDRITGKLGTFASDAKIIHIDIDTAAISKNVTVDVPLVGDAKEAIALMLSIAENEEPCKVDEWLSRMNEWHEQKPLVMEEKEKLIAEGVKVSDTLQVGIMIEIPAAAVLAHKFAKEVDFFSVGTNDLVQYTFAADRMSSGVSYLYQPFNPSILNLLKHVIDSAHAEGKWAGMCGEMAGEAIAAPLLLGLGLDEFSMSATSILAQRKLIKSVSKADMEALVEKALDCATSEEVIELVKSTVKM